MVDGAAADIAVHGRLLVVEDHPVSRRAMCRCLGDYELLEASSGEEALALVDLQRVDLVLLDIGLPGIDGYEVLRRLRTAGARCKVILVTARGDSREVVQGFENRADDYVVKPFRQDELVARVRNALRLKALEDELRRINENLEQEVSARTAQLLAQQTFALLGRHAAQFVHNLNSPLTALMGYLELARDIEDDRDELLERALEVAQDMQGVVARLLTEVRSGAGRVQSVEPLDLNEVVRNQVELWQVHPEFRYRLKIECELAEPLPRVLIDRGDVSQILTNLIDNALHAVREVDQPRLIFRTSRTGPWVWLEVADNGYGIAPEHLDQVFEPLFTTKPVGEGTGLGLASCRELAEAAGGRLVVGSQLGVGTTIRLELPLREAESAG